ncbi:MAG: NAD-dependent malic enzyme [Candidatus Hydrogenedentes bacterium]|nr:NAD-dependent malic enzyme [Candidatus Hydrogenedentota bacterium]
MDENTAHTTASYSATVRVSIENKPGSLAKVLSAIGDKGGQMDAIDLVEGSRASTIRDLTVLARDEDHLQEILHALRKLKRIKVLRWWDRVFRSHQGGKIEIQNRLPVRTRDDLSIVYTPGVARVCTMIHQHPERVNGLTIKGNSVAVVTDGTAVLGLGDIGPEAALPVMEGKAMLFKEFGDIDAWPICLATKDVDEIVRTVELIAPGFGGINLEDISAPRCFEIEEKLKGRLRIPVFHDDQHGTAVVVLAALINALKLIDMRPEELRVVISGVGAAGMACAKMMLNFGVKDIVGVDRNGAIYHGRTGNMTPAKEWFADHTNPDRVRGGIVDVANGRHMFLGLSGPGLFPLEALKRMAKKPIVFALANPTPEILPEEAAPYARIIATGRSDYPNQINNVLAFPGIFKGALEARATGINEEMKLAAAHAIASIIPEEDLFEELIVPSVFDKRVARAVSRAVRKAAINTGVGR